MGSIAEEALHPGVVATRTAATGALASPCPLSFSIGTDGCVRDLSGLFVASFADLDGKPFCMAFSAITPSMAGTGHPGLADREAELEIELREGGERIVGVISAPADRGTGATFVALCAFP